MTPDFLSSDVEIKGTLKLGAQTQLDGKVEGEIQSSGTLVIQAHGSVKGNIVAKTVTIFGKVEGNVTTAERCELKSTGQLIGDLKSPRLIIEEGATYIGHSQVGPKSST